MKVGFIGLGLMGRPMALHLEKAGHALCASGLSGIVLNYWLPIQANTNSRWLPRNPQFEVLDLGCGRTQLSELGNQRLNSVGLIGRIVDQVCDGDFER